MADETRTGGAESGAPPHGGPVGPEPGRITRAFRYPPEDEGRQRQDFLAGTVLAAGAALLAPGAPGPDRPGPLFTLLVHEDVRTYGPAPQLRDAFALLDAGRTEEARSGLGIGTGWSALGGPDPLVKLNLKFPGPSPRGGLVHLVLPARQYGPHWHAVAAGGLLGISSEERLRRAAGRPGATFADALEGCLLLGTGTSPVLEHLVTVYGWEP
ncbi:hypothetical protein [Streptomyces sp. NPDC097619]|uniref:hypothetical protein n=1 Tax=Streptomyces sp. NPDC097619 TaxID=3157228 RepID=UPI00332F4CD5